MKSIQNLSNQWYADPSSLSYAPTFMIGHSAESNEKSISPIYFMSYDWLYLQFLGDTPGFSSGSPTKKKPKLFKSGQIYGQDAQ